MNEIDQVQARLRASPKKWLVTGVAGFIGSNLLESLLRLDQSVVGLDNFSTGHRSNLEDVRRGVSAAQWARFSLHEGDIRNLSDCAAGCAGVNYVLHQAALGSVPRSVADPIATNNVNIDGFLNMLVAARDAHVESFVYAASSSTYGDHPALPKVEDRIGRPLSPYAVTKLVNEIYADVFARTYGFRSIGLRYFNVFGRRQDPSSAYAAVIPKWVFAMLSGQHVDIYGDGETSRDFCYVENAVQANMLAAVATGDQATNQVYNIAAGGRTSLKQLFEILRDTLADLGVPYSTPPRYAEFRTGDVRHSQADIGKAAGILGYAPAFDVRSGMRDTLTWYLQKFRPSH